MEDNLFAKTHVLELLYGHLVNHAKNTTLDQATVADYHRNNQPVHSFPLRHGSAFYPMMLLNTRDNTMGEEVHNSMLTAIRVGLLMDYLGERKYSDNGMFILTQALTEAIRTLPSVVASMSISYGKFSKMLYDVLDDIIEKSPDSRFISFPTHLTIPRKDTYNPLSMNASIPVHSLSSLNVQVLHGKYSIPYAMQISSSSGVQNRTLMFPRTFLVGKGFLAHVMDPPWVNPGNLTVSGLTNTNNTNIVTQPFPVMPSLKILMCTMVNREAFRLKESMQKDYTADRAVEIWLDRDFHSGLFDPFLWEYVREKYVFPAFLQSIKLKVFDDLTAGILDTWDFDGKEDEVLEQILFDAAEITPSGSFINEETSSIEHNF